jgi:hypothetical protein
VRPANPAPRKAFNQQEILMLRLVALALAVLLAGCVTTEVDDQGNPVKRGPTDEIVTDKAGRLILRPTHIKPPTTIIVNEGTPTEREIILLGVEGASKEQAPITFAKIEEYYDTWVAPEAQREIYVKPGLGADLNARTIYGLVYVQAFRDAGDRKVEIIPDAYLCINQAMVSEGLLRMRDPREIPDERLRASMVELEKEAKRKKLGLWSEIR